MTRRALVRTFLSVSLLATSAGAHADEAGLAALGSVRTAFDPARDGYAFENGGMAYPKTPPFLTPADLIILFGHRGLCKNKSGPCVPTATAAQWLKTANKGTNNGVCEGMAVSAMTLYSKRKLPRDYTRGAKTAVALSLENNLKLRRLIGRMQVAQEFPETQRATVKGAPNEVLKRLVQHLREKPSEPVTLGFYGKAGGHAVAPYAVEDKGGGVYWVMIYDSNHPKTPRYIAFDTNANTWKYDFAAVNAGEPADVWQGDASGPGIEFTPISVYLAKFTCTLCPEGTPEAKPMETFLLEDESGLGGLRVVDTKDEKSFIGFKDGKVTNQMAGADWSASRARVGGMHRRIVLRVPAGKDYGVVIDGTGYTAAEKVDLAIFGPSRSIRLRDLAFLPGQVDLAYVSGSGKGILYKPGTGKKKPHVIITADHPGGKDYTFEVEELEVGGGQSCAVDVDEKTGRLKVERHGGDATSTYRVSVSREDEDGKTESFSNDKVQIGKDEAEHFDYGSWEGQGKPMKLHHDADGEGHPARDEALADDDHDHKDDEQYSGKAEGDAEDTQASEAPQQEQD